MNQTNKVKTMLEWAMEYVALGWPLLPCYGVKPEGDCRCGGRHPMRRKKDGTFGVCKSPGKHPVSKLVPKGCKNASLEIAQIKKWFSVEGVYNVAVATGETSQGWLTVVDVDIVKGKTGPQTLAALQAENDELPNTLSQTTGSGGEQYLFWSAGEVRNDTESKLGPGLDVRGSGGYIIVPPSIHVKGGYRWNNWPLGPASMPEWLETLANGRATATRVKAAPLRARTVNAKPLSLPKDDPDDRLTPFQVRELLLNIPAGNRVDWMMFGHVMKTVATWLGGEEEAFRIWDTWAETGAGYAGELDQRSQWESFGNPTEHPIALLKSHAKAEGWVPSQEFQSEERRWRAEAANKNVEVLTETSSPDEVRALLKVLAVLPELDRHAFLNEIKKRTKNRFNLKPMREEMEGFQSAHATAGQGQTDVGMRIANSVLAQHFNHGKHLIRTSDQFFSKYNGRFWEQVQSEEEIGNYCIQATLDLGPIKKDVSTIVSQAIDNLTHLQATPGDPLRLAQPPLPVINCRNGELWFREDFTVDVRPHRPESFLRFCQDLDYDPSAICPMFDQALLDIFQESPEPEEMRRHMMEIFGYAIQPRRHIKMFQLWFGGGDNGKSKVCEVLCELAGLQAVAPGRIQQLAKSEYYMANLRSKLIFRDDDVDANTVLPDGILKQLSEGKYVVGRDPYGRPKEFNACVLPIMLCNQYPVTRDLSQGTLQRAYIVPFRHQFIRGRDRDDGLFVRIIKEEMAGILNGAIGGFQRLMKRGHFLEPQDCLIAKEEFLNEANPLPRFLSSGYCIRTLEEEIEDLTAELSVSMEVLKGRRDAVEEIQCQIEVITARAEKAGLEGVSQTTQDLYNHLIQWCRNEGNNWKPKKADVERDLVNLGFPISKKSGQWRVYRLRSKGVPDLRPM